MDPVKVCIICLLFLHLSVNVYNIMLHAHYPLHQTLKVTMVDSVSIVNSPLPKDKQKQNLTRWILFVCGLLRSWQIYLIGLKVPPIKKRGRPKGSELTTIGLPAKESERENIIKKPCSFSCSHSSERYGWCIAGSVSMHVACTMQLFSWFVEKKVISDGNLIAEEHVECRPERILDENVDVLFGTTFPVMHGCLWSQLSRESSMGV